MRREANYRIPSVDFNCLSLPAQRPRSELITDRSGRGGGDLVSRCRDFQSRFPILAGRASSVRRADNVGGRRDRSNGIHCLINVKLRHK